MANTFTRPWEFRPYHQQAEEPGWKCVILTVAIDHQGVSAPGVSENQFQRMRNHYYAQPMLTQDEMEALNKNAQ